MWITEYTDDSINYVKFLRGPKISVGRKSDSDILFLNDKSISRVHAIIYVSLDKISIVDNNSTFHTWIGDLKLEPNKSYDISDGDYIKFGAIDSHIRVRKMTYAFCTTRLDKQSKEHLKECVKLTGSRMVNNIADATHLITNQVAATTKLLESIVEQKSIIRFEWLNSFAGKGNIHPAPVIPNCQDYLPSGAYDLSTSRDSLFSHLLILMILPSDSEYSNILKKCGASIINCWENKNDSLADRVQIGLERSREDSYKGRKVSIFIDEANTKIDSLMDSLNNISIAFFLSGQMAKSIITFTTPSVDNGLFNSQVISNLFSQSQMNLSQNPIPTHKANLIVSKSIPHNNSATIPKDVANIPLSIHVNDKNVDKFEEITPDLVNRMESDEVPKELNIEPSLNFEINEITKDVNKSNSQENNQNYVFEFDSAVNKSAISDYEADRDADGDGDRDGVNHIDSKEEIIPEETVYNNCEKLNRFPDTSFGNEKSTVIELDSLKESFKSVIDDKVIEDPEGWIKNPVTHNNYNFELDCMDSKDITIEEVIQMNTHIPMNKNEKSSSALSEKNIEIPRNIKKFKKNHVKVPSQNDLLYYSDMDRVLPKESERELQLRLEAEAEDRMNFEAEEIFSDKLVRNRLVK